MSEINLPKGEPVDRALRRLKKKLGREQTLLQVRLNRRSETQCQEASKAESCEVRRDAQGARRSRLIRNENRASSAAADNC